MTHPILENYSPIERGVHIYGPLARGNFFDSDTFHRNLQTYSFLDVCTFTFTWGVVDDNKLRRLIVTIPPADLGIKTKAKILLVQNNHLKLYLCYNSLKQKPHVFVGSYNLVHPSLIDGVVRLRGGDAQHLINWFNQTWKAHYKHETRTNPQRPN